MEHRIKELTSELICYRELAAKYLKELDQKQEQYDDLKKQRDDLLDALKKISDTEDERYTHSGYDNEVNNIAKQAIARQKK